MSHAVVYTDSFSTAKPKSFTDYAVGDIEPLPEPAELAVLSGMPEAHQKRTVCCPFVVSII